MDTRERFNIIEYIVCCVSNFAEKYNIDMAQAYSYLEKFEGIKFLLTCYDIEHTLSIEDAVDDIQAICFRNGGHIS